jgi:cytochrome c556
MMAGALAAAALLGSAEGVVAQAQGRQADPPAVAYRKAVMDATVAHVMALRALVGSNLGHEADIRKHTAALLATATTFDGIFAPGSTGGASNAREEIWSSSAVFKARMVAFQEAARTLDQEVATGAGVSVYMPRLQMLIGTCGGCHTAFKLPAPLPF